MVDKKLKERLIKKFQTHEGDTGSPQVQIAILTEEIKELVAHLEAHMKDFSSRRGLLKKVSERRRLLKYLGKENPVAHDELAKQLKLKVKSAVEAAAAPPEPLIGATKKKMPAVVPGSGVVAHAEPSEHHTESTS